MSHSDAVIMGEIHKIIKKQGRGVYSGDLASRQIVPKGRSQKKLEELKNAGYLREEVEKGANLYTITPKGMQHMTAYRDIKIEAEAV